MNTLLVGPKSSVWSSRMHIHMGLGYLAGALIAAELDRRLAGEPKLKNIAGGTLDDNCGNLVVECFFQSVDIIKRYI